MLGLLIKKQMHDSVITDKEYAFKDWTSVISMFLTSYNVYYFVCGCACFMQSRINNNSKCSHCYGPRAFGSPAVFCNNSYLLHYIDLFQSKKSAFAKFAVSSKRRFPIESCLCPEILVWFFLYSYVTNCIRLRSAVLRFLLICCKI